MNDGDLVVILQEIRENCHVYVLPEDVNDRPLAKRRKKSSAPGGTLSSGLAKTLDEAKAELSEAVELLELVVDKEKCQYDSEHSCQTHGDLLVPEDEKCRNGRISDFLRAQGSRIV